MKQELEIKIPKYLEKEINSLKDEPIRGKKELIDLILYVVELIIIKLEAENKNYYPAVNEDNIIYINSKMRRLFFKCNNKLFSISSPFYLRNTEVIEEKTKIVLDRKLLNVLRYINEVYEKISTPLDIYETDDNRYSEDEITEAWKVYSGILFNESGYIRYDYDEKHENQKLHPLNHLDIFYSRISTLKIGIEDRIDLEEFIDILNIETNCKYLNKKK